MAAQYVTQYDIKRLNTEQLAILIMDASQALRWALGSVRGGFSLTVPASTWSKGEFVTIMVIDHHHLVTIESKYTQRHIGWGNKNKKNVAALIAKLDELQLQQTPAELTQRYNIIAQDEASYEKEAVIEE